MQKQFDQILQKRMDRKDFLRHVGIGVAVMTGLAGALKLLHPQGQGQVAENNKNQSVAMGYGASVYGGRPAAANKS